MSSTEVRLLLVDDDPSAIQAMSSMLGQYPNQRFATSGADALRLAQVETPDLIVMDVDMPSMSGFDVCAALKADPVLAKVPVILATSHESTALLEAAALQRGAVELVRKPLNPARLAASVAAQLFRALRADAGPPRPAVPAAVGPAGSRTPRLLIVDDDTASIHVLRHTLAALGDLHFAKSGEAALRIARQLVPDLILLDAHMPGLDGFDVCRTLKAEASFRHVPIAFVTRYSDPRYETRALDLGAADFIAKPYTPAVLQARVRNLLDLKRRTDAELEAVRELGRRLGDARVAEIIDAAWDAIVSFDAENRIVLANAAACQMFGVGREEVIGARAQTLLGAQVCGAGPLPAGPALASMARADGSRFPAELSVSRAGEGAQRLTTVILRDTSDRERLDAESHLRIEAETASRAKTMMMAYVAHEMGNPLSGLLGFAQLMREDAGNPLAPAQAHRLEHIITSGRHLESLMRDVTDVGRFDSGRLAIELTPVDAASCVAAAVAAVATLAAQAGVTIESRRVPPAIRIAVDADRLRQCLLNLLTNAVKYNRPGGWVRIEVTDDSHAVTIAVRDNGLGMDERQRAHLFEPFNRLGRQGSAARGEGLGLVITRRLVEAMQGRLEVASSEEQGSCFSIVLPSTPGVALPPSGPLLRIDPQPLETSFATGTHP